MCTQSLQEGANGRTRCKNSRCHHWNGQVSTHICVSTNCVNVHASVFRYCKRCTCVCPCSSGSLDPAAQREANAWLQHFISSNECVIEYSANFHPACWYFQFAPCVPQGVVREPAAAGSPRNCDPILWCKHAVLKSSIVVVGPRGTCARSTVHRTAVDAAGCCEWHADAGGSLSK